MNAIKNNRKECIRLDTIGEAEGDPLRIMQEV